MGDGSSSRQVSTSIQWWPLDASSVWVGYPHPMYGVKWKGDDRISSSYAWGYKLYSSHVWGEGYTLPYDSSNIMEPIPSPNPFTDIDLWKHFAKIRLRVLIFKGIYGTEKQRWNFFSWKGSKSSCRNWEHLEELCDEDHRRFFLINGHQMYFQFELKVYSFISFNWVFENKWISVFLITWKNYVPLNCQFQELFLNEQTF